MSDFRLVEGPPYPPAACLVTGRADGPLVDTNITDNFGNRLYLHPTVIDQAGALLGLVPRGEHEAVVAAHEGSAARIAALEVQLEQAEELRLAVARTLHTGATIDRKGRLQLAGLTQARREELGVLVK
jgi:hypothetical protein